MKKILITFLIIVVLIVSSVNVIDKNSSEVLDKAFIRAVSVFAIARALNGIISVIQGTEIYATPAGIGVDLAVGQIVDPINDMVERFSWIMLMSSVSLGVQKIMLELGQTEILKIFLALSAVLLVLMLWIHKLWQRNIFNVVFKSFIILSFLRFSVPLMILCNEAIYDYILKSRYVESKTALSISNSEMKEIINDIQENQQLQEKIQKQEEKNISIIQKLKNKVTNYVNKIGSFLNIKEHLQSLKRKLLNNLKNKFDAAVNHILTLIIIFIVESILLPLLFLWIFIWLFKSFLYADISKFIEKDIKKNINLTPNNSIPN